MCTVLFSPNNPVNQGLIIYENQNNWLSNVLLNDFFGVLSEDEKTKSVSRKRFLATGNRSCQLEWTGCKFNNFIKTEMENTVIGHIKLRSDFKAGIRLPS